MPQNVEITTQTASRIEISQKTSNSEKHKRRGGRRTQTLAEESETRFFIQKHLFIQKHSSLKQRNSKKYSSIEIESENIISFEGR